MFRHPAAFLALLAGEGTASAPSAPRTQALTIQKIEFQAPAPYNEGDTMNLAEANTLNQTLGENLRNNFADKVKKAVEAAGEAGLSAESTERLRVEFAEYAASYEFQGRRQRRETLDPVGREALKMAKVAVHSAIRARDMKIEELPEDHVEKLIKQYAAKPEVQAEAQRRVDATRSLAADDLDFTVPQAAVAQ